MENCWKSGEVRIKSLAEKDASKLPHFHGIINNIEVLGFNEKPVWKRTEKVLIINTQNIQSDKPVVFKFMLD